MSSFITKNKLFYSTITVTGITLLLFVMANYKYNNFLLTNANMIYITSLILGLGLTMFIAFKNKKDDPNKPGETKETEETIKTIEDIDENSEKATEAADGVKSSAEYYLPMSLKNKIRKVKQNLLNSVPGAKQAAKNLIIDLKDDTLIGKYVAIYKLVFEILTIDAIIANNRTTALNKIANPNVFNATIDNVRANMLMINSMKAGLPDNKEILSKLNKLSKLIDTIKVTLDINIIVALQLIYDLDTKNSPFSTQILHQAESEAIQHLSTLSSLKPDNDNKYFDEDIYIKDYTLLDTKLNELDAALFKLLGKQIKHDYAIIADSIQASRYIFGVSGSSGSKGRFKDLVETVFDNDNITGGIYRFTDKLFDIIQNIKNA